MRDEKSDIKRIFAPFMMVLPVVIPILTIVGLVTHRMCRYITPMYDTDLRIRMDNKDYSFSRNNLYKDFDVLTASDKVLTEVQVLKSDLIILKALDDMNIPVTYKRVGQMMTTELYPLAPFTVVLDTLHPVKKDVDYMLYIYTGDSISICENEDCEKSYFDYWFEIGGGRLKIIKNQKWIEKNELEAMYGEFQFRVNTLEGLKSEFVGDNLLVKEIDKDIDIIRINFSGENAQKIADFTNQLAESFTNEYLETKVKAATLTAEFINSQITQARERLIESESKIEQFRYDQNLLNSKQELEIGLKKISQLEVQLANLALKKITMDSLIVYVQEDAEDYTKYAPSFESYGGLLFVELMKKYQSLLDKRRELSAQYTQESIEIREVNEKLKQTKAYIKNSITNHRELVNYQYDLLKERVEFEKTRFDNLPTKERNLLIYQRDFKQNEDIYNFLSKKKMEADIAKSVDLSFHKIIKKAKVPKVPTSPQKSFISALVVLAVLLVIVFLVYMYDYLKAGMYTKKQFEESLGYAIDTFIVKDTTDGFTVNSDMMLDIKSPNDGENLIAVASPYKKEGKTYFSKCLIETQLSRYSNKIRYISLKDNPEILGQWRQHDYDKSYIMDGYDYVILDTHEVSGSKWESTILNHVDHIFFVLKNKHTKKRHVKFILDIIESYKLKDFSFVLNEYHPYTNYLGEISVSNRFRGKTKGTFTLLRRVVKWYTALWVI